MGNLPDDVVRYVRLTGTRTERTRQMKEQLDQFEKDAKAGKRICLTDLIGNAESILPGVEATRDTHESENE